MSFSVCETIRASGSCAESPSPDALYSPRSYFVKSHVFCTPQQSANKHDRFYTIRQSVNHHQDSTTQTKNRRADFVGASRDWWVCSHNPIVAG
jgi:hypothetical protein